MQEVAELRAEGVKEGEAGAEEIRGERMVESEIVVNTEDIRAEREKKEVERKDKGEEKTEGVEKVREEENPNKDAGEENGSNNEGEASMEIVRLRSDDEIEVMGNKKGKEKMEEESENIDGVEGDCMEITEEVARETGTIERGATGRAERRARRFSKRLAGIMASGEVLPEVEKVEEMEIVPSDEEEEDEEISLKRRLRASRATDQVATASEGPRESSYTHSSISIPLTPEDEVVLEAPEKEEETPHVEKKAPKKKTVNEGIPEESER